MDKTASFVSLRDILKVLFKHKGIILTIAAMATFTTAVVVFLMPPTFEATSHVLVKRTLQEAEDPSLGQDPRGASSVIRQIGQADEINTEVAVIRSRDLVVRVAEELGLTREQFERVPDFRRYVRATYNWLRDTLKIGWNEIKYFLRLSRRPTPQEAAELEKERFIKALTDAQVVEQVTDSDVIRVGFRCSDPRLAQRLSNLLCERAIPWHIDKFRQSGNVAFFQEQTAKARETLNALDKELANKRRNLNLIGIEDRKKLLIQNQLHSRGRLNEVRARIAAIEAGVAEIREILASEPSMVTLSKETATNPVREQVSEKLSELELKRIEAMAKFEEDGRTVKDMDRTLGGWRAQRDALSPHRENSKVEGINNVYQTLRQQQLSYMAEKAALIAEARVVRKQIESFDRDLGTINENAYRVEEIERLSRSQAMVYDQYLKSMEQSRAGEARQRAQLANLSIIQAAPLPLSPVKPRKWLYILLAAAGGIFFGIAWAFAAEFNDNTIESEADLQAEIGCPVLGTVRKHG